MNDIQFKNALCFVGFFTALLSTIKWTCLEAISALLKTVGFNVSMLLSRVVSKIFSSRNKSWVWKSGLQFETLHLSVNSADSQLSGPKIFRHTNVLKLLLDYFGWFVCFVCFVLFGVFSFSNLVCHLHVCETQH